MEIPGLGAVTKDLEFGWYVSAPRPVAALGGIVCRLVVDGYDEDPANEDFHAAIDTFLLIDDRALRAAAPEIFAYYQDTLAESGADAEWMVEISGPDEVWDHIRIGDHSSVERESCGDHRIYVSVECECDWEPEHGLQIVFLEGRTVTKIGPYDGHLTNAAAYGREDLADVIYPRIASD